MIMEAVLFYMLEKILLESLYLYKMIKFKFIFVEINLRKKEK